MSSTQRKRNGPGARQPGLGRRVPRGLLLGAVVLTGCGSPVVTSYRVPRNEASAVSPSKREERAPVASLPPPEARGWNVPARWREIPPGRSGLATYVIGGAGGDARVGVTALSSVAGHESEVVNLWREALGLSRIGGEEARRSLRPVRIGGDAGQLFEASAEGGGVDWRRLLVAAMVHRDGTSWFYMLTGDAAVVRAEKPAFLGFLESARVPRATTTAGEP